MDFSKNNDSTTSLNSESTVLVDAAALTRSLSCVHRDFSILEFLDLCTAIEAIVLNDLITVLDPSSELTDSNQEMKLLEKHGVLQSMDSGVKSADDGSVVNSLRKKMSGLMDIGLLPKSPLGKTTFGDAFREATVVSEAERRLQISALPLRRFSCFYEPKVLVREEHTACDLVTNYDILSRDLRKGRSLYQYPIADYIIAEIPPMPIIALGRSQTRERLLETVLELRDEYSSLRTSLSQLRATLGNAEVTPIEKQRHLRSWARSWRTLEKYGPPTHIAVANTIQSAIDVDRSVDGKYLDLNLNKLTSLAINSAREEWHKWRVRILHDAAKQYLNTSDGIIYRETQRLFGHELSANDLQQLKEWDAQMVAMVDNSSSNNRTIH